MLGYRLRVYGGGGGFDEQFDAEQPAIERGRAEVSERDVWAEVVRLVNGSVVWHAYRDQKTGSVVEKYDREPGSD